MNRIRLVAAGGLIVAFGLVVPIDDVGAQRPVPEQAVTPCPDPVDPIELSSVEQVEELLVRTWIQCEGDLLFPASGGNEVGIELTSDGRFHRVYDDGGVLIRAEGLEQEGGWEVIDTTDVNGPGSYQVDFTPVGSGPSSLLPEFFGAPSLMTSPDIGEAAFVPWTGDAPVSGIPTGVGEGPCGLPSDPVALTSVAQVEELLAGAWVRCGPESALGPIQPDEVGLEFATGGRLVRLFDDGAGGLVRGEAVDGVGTWEVIDTTEMNGPGSYQVNLTITGGTRTGFAAILEQPEHFRFVGSPLGDYQRASVAPVDAVDLPPTGDLPRTGTSTGLAMVALASIVGGGVVLWLGRCARRFVGTPG